VKVAPHAKIKNRYSARRPLRAEFSATPRRKTAPARPRRMSCSRTSPAPGKPARRR